MAISVQARRRIGGTSPKNVLLANPVDRGTYSLLHIRIRVCRHRESMHPQLQRAGRHHDFITPKGGAIFASSSISSLHSPP
jgi:hypothetical protein